MKKTLSYHIVLLAFLIFELPERVAAQDTHNFTQFYFNPSLLNPSYTGTEGQTALFLSFKKQWAGMEGSPAIANLNIQTTLANQLSLGFNLSNDKSGLLNSSAVLFTGAYRVNLSPTQSLHFGLSIGTSSTTVDASSLNFATPGDPVIAGLVKSNFQMIGNMGISFHSKTFHGGVALPNIFQPSYLNSDAFTISKVNPFGSVIIHASNRFYLAKGKNAFEPYLVYRLNSSIPSQLEAAAVFHIQNIVYVGGSYKQDFGVSALGGFKINKQTALGYSYTLMNTGSNEIGKPSHEFHFAYLFGQRRKNLPVYSFINTELEQVHKKTPQELAAEKRKHEAELAKQEQEEKNKQALANKELEEKKKKELSEKAAAELIRDATVPHDTIRRKAILTPTEEEHLSRLEEHADNPTEVHNEEHHPNAERHETVKQGGHPLELELGDYVVAGVFGVEANAKKYANGLRKLGFEDTRYGFLTVNNRWYVWIFQSQDIEAARKSRDEFRKMKIFREAWLLTVQK